MFYKLNHFVFVRNINDTLEIIDKRNDDQIYGDYNSFIFLKNLSYEPQSVDKIIENICNEYSPKPDKAIVKKDVVNLFSDLIKTGFVSCGETYEDCLKNAKKFSYEEYPDWKLPALSEDLNEELIDRLKIPTVKQVMVEITKKCNERCVHCYIPHETKNIMMSDADFYNIVDQCAEFGTCIDFKVSGGECMSHPSFKNFIKYVKSKGFALTVVTNLTLLDDEVVEILKNGLLSNVQVTLFSVNPEIHDKITTVKGSLHKTLENLEKLRKANVPVTIATQCLELNKNEIGGLFDFCNKNNFKFLCDWTIVAKEDCNKDNLDFRIKDLSCYSNLCKMRMHYDKRYEDEFRQALKNPLKEPTCYLCNAGMNGFQIGADLSVHCCPGWNLTLGNLKTASLFDIWNNSEKLKEIRNTRLVNFPKCVSCKNRNICHLCMAQAYNENAKDNHYEMPEYVCKMYSVLIESVENTKPQGTERIEEYLL